MKPSNIHTIIFDFDGVFTDNKVYVDQKGNEMVCCDRRDGLGIDMLRNYLSEHEGIEAFILSTETNPVVAARAEKLKLNCFQASKDKLAFLNDYLGQRFGDIESNYQGVVYLGNDLNDLEVMKVVGYPVAPNDAHPEIKKIARKVLKENGGQGFVREFIEVLLHNEVNTKKGERHDTVSNS